MKKCLFVLAIFAVSFWTAPAQKIAKPTLVAKPATAAQSQLISEGTRLHDAKQYDAAIERYQKVLAENPDCTEAIYELSLSLYTKGDKVKAMEMADRGSKYKAPELPLFYGIMANVIDDVGKPDEAVKIYRDAIKIIENDPDFVTHLASLHYNLGITFVRQRKLIDAREELKRAVMSDFKYPSPHYLLAVVFSGTKYRIPAVMAATRLISLEFNTERTKRSAAIVYDALKPAVKDEKSGNTQILLDLNAPKDEGDFGMYDLILGVAGVAKDNKQTASQGELMTGSMASLIDLLATDKKLSSTFVGKNYIPFMLELKQKGYVKPLVFLVLFHQGDPEGLKWISENDAKMVEFVNWAKSYQQPK